MLSEDDIGKGSIAIAHKAFFDNLAIQCTICTADSREQALRFIEEMSGVIQEAAVLLELIGHGSDPPGYYGRKGIMISWQELLPLLGAVNESCGNQLILNAMSICESDCMLADVNENNPPFFAAIFSKAKVDLASGTIAQMLYERSVGSLKTTFVLELLNKANSQGETKYQWVVYPTSEAG